MDGPIWTYKQKLARRGIEEFKERILLKLWIDARLPFMVSHYLPFTGQVLFCVDAIWMAKYPQKTIVHEWIHAIFPGFANVALKRSKIELEALSPDVRDKMLFAIMGV